MKLDFGRSIENDVEGLSLDAQIEDSELDRVFGDPTNAPLFAALYSPTFETKTGAEKAQLFADLVKLVEAPQATNLGLKSEPEQPA